MKYVIFFLLVFTVEIAIGQIISPMPHIARAIEKKINLYRQSRGIQSLAYQNRIDTIASNHAFEMSKWNFFDHTNPKSKQWAKLRDRFRYFGYGYAAIAENIAYQEYQNMTISDSIIINEFVQSWIKSPPHLANLISRNYSEHAVAVYRIVKPNQRIEFKAVHNFGQPRR